MRLAFRKIEDALLRLDKAVRGLFGRVDALESIKQIDPEQLLDDVLAKVPDVQDSKVEGAVNRWLEDNPLEVDPNSIEGLITETLTKYLAENPPKDGQNATPEQIAQAVKEYLLANPIPEPVIRYDEIVAMVKVEVPDVDYDQVIRGVLALLPKPDPVDYALIVDEAVKKIPTPKDGEPGQPGPRGEKGQKGDKGNDGISIQKAEIVGRDLFLTYSNGVSERVGQVVGKDGEDGQTTVKIEQGEPGADGVGIADIYQDGDDLVIGLTNGEEKRFKLPKGKVLAGGGVSQSRVIELIDQFSPSQGHKRYTTLLDGFNVLIEQHHHHLPHVSNVEVLSPVGKSVSIDWSLNQNNDVLVSSLINLRDHRVIII